MKNINLRLFLITLTILSFVFVIVTMHFTLAIGQYLYCVDSDNGVTYDVSGSVGYSYVSVPMPGEISYFNDSCRDYLGYYTSECYGGGCSAIWDYGCTPDGGGYNTSFSSGNCISLGYDGCKNGACINNISSASCSDSIKNQDESDVDCGGICGATCELDELCNTNLDCESSICYTSGPTDYCFAGLMILNRGDNDQGNQVWNEGLERKEGVLSRGSYVVMAQVKLEASQWEDIRLLDIKARVRLNDNMASIEPLLVMDNNGDGIYDAADTIVGPPELVSGLGYSYAFWTVGNLDVILEAYDIKNFLILYGMRGPFANGENFTLYVDDAGGTGITSNEYIDAIQVGFTKTLVINVSGASPSDVGDEVGEGEGIICYPGSVFCAPVPFGCDSEDAVTGDIIVDPTEEECIPQVYECNAEGTNYIPSSGAYYERICSLDCQNGGVRCDYASGTALVCEDGVYYPYPDDYIITQDVIADPESPTAFEYYCSTSVINTSGFCITDYFCDWLAGILYTCNEGEWTNFEESSGEYQLQCEGRECTGNMFRCNPATERISWCDSEDFVYGDETEQDYELYCIEGGGEGVNRPAAYGGEGNGQIIEGEIVNGTLRVYKGATDPAIIRDVILGFNKLWIILGALIVVIIGFIAYKRFSMGKVKIKRKK